MRLFLFFMYLETRVLVHEVRLQSEACTAQGVRTATKVAYFVTNFWTHKAKNMPRKPLIKF
jgi:hypothetical protein